LACAGRARSAFILCGHGADHRGALLSAGLPVSKRRHAMNVIMYLYRQSPLLLVFATLTSLLGGLASAGMASVMSHSISAETSLVFNASAFFCLCATHLAFRSWSEITLIKLAQSMMMRLRITLSQQLLSTPQEKLQRLSKSDLFVILTRDIAVFSQTAQLLPMMFNNLVIIVGCLVYLAWISWQLSAILLGCMIISMVLYPIVESAPLRKLRLVRELTDGVYRHLRGLIDGSKELQLNDRRARQFIDKILGPDLNRFRTASIDGLRNYIWVSNGGALMFYLVIGVTIFITPFWLPLPLPVRVTVALIGLYLVSPISAIIGSLPLLREADIALRKIQQIAASLNEAPTTEAPDIDDDSTLRQQRVSRLAHDIAHALRP
jgi:putative pyoverdin transport system ATP-binding/permease protein